jgi:hypothetical protein
VMALSETEVEKYLEDGFRALELGEAQCPRVQSWQFLAKASPWRCLHGGQACT